MTKKRYSLSLTQETVEEFQAVIKQMKLAPSAMSSLCDEAIASSLQMFKSVSAKGEFTVTNLFSAMGEIMEEKYETSPVVQRKAQPKQERTKAKGK
jgi:hypothetical protein